jgi:hypothetical protein
MKLDPFKPKIVASLFDNINWNSPAAISNKPIVYESK